MTLKIEAALERLRNYDSTMQHVADITLILAHVAALEQRLAAEARAERYATVMRRCERWFTAYLEGHDDGQYEAGSILPAIRAALTEGGGES